MYFVLHLKRAKIVTDMPFWINNVLKNTGPTICVAVMSCHTRLIMKGQFKSVCQINDTPVHTVSSIDGISDGTELRQWKM
jgi:hypothetical protein